MKRFRILALAALVLGSSFQSAHALGVFASWWQIDENNTDGFGFGLNERINFTHLLGIEGRASWVSFSGVDQTETGTSYDLTVVPLEAAGILTVRHFYGGLGVGYYIFDASAVSFDNEVGWFGLVGVIVGLGPVKLFADAKWTQVEVNVQDSTETVTGDGIGVNVGIAMRI